MKHAKCFMNKAIYCKMRPSLPVALLERLFTLRNKVQILYQLQVSLMFLYTKKIRTEAWSNLYKIYFDISHQGKQTPDEYYFGSPRIIFIIYS